MYATKLCHKHVTLTDILAASKNIESRDFSINHTIPSTHLPQATLTDEVADINHVLFQNHNYQPLIYLDRVVRYIGDVGILVRMIGLHPIEFIELKNTLCQEPVLKDSWNSIYTLEDDSDVSFDVKVITVRIIYSIMQMCLRGIKLTSPGEYRIAHDAAIRILTVVGWTTINLQTPSNNITLIESIINFAVKGLIPENIKIMLDSDSSKVSGVRYIKIPIHTILTVMPDIHLLVNITYCNANGYRFTRANNMRNFITIQLTPYYVEFTGIMQKNYNRYIQNILLIIIKKIYKDQDLYNCILMDKKKMEYDVDTWYKHVINNLGNLYYKGDNCLNLETIADNTELYNNLISLIHADKFLDHMAEHEASIFYNLLNDDIQVLTEIKEIKNDMFIAFASAHMADILTRCGTVLTEDVFHTVFGIKPTCHHLRLLHRGILLRESLMWLYQTLTIKPKKHNSDEICVRNNIQDTRMSHRTALELLCTYFQGLDKIVKIKPPEPKWLPDGSFDLNRKSITLHFTNKISLIEYPLPLRVSFTESIYKSTKVLLNLQKFLSEHKYIGINGVQLSRPINLDLNSLTGDDLKIFQYFTGYKDVVDFKDWVNKILTPPIKDNRLSTLLDLAKTKDVQKQFMFIMIVMSVSHRDFTLLRREPYQLMEKGFKKVLFPKFDSDIFDKLHDYAQLMSSFLQYDNREKEVLDEVQANLHNTYINIISDDDVLFEVNIQQCDEVGTKYNIVSDALLKNTKEMLLRDTPKTILDGKRIHLIPYIVNNKKRLLKRTLYKDIISYTKFYKLSTHKTDISTISNQQSSSSAVTPSKRSSSYCPSILPSDTILPKKSRKKTTIIHTNHVSSADTVTISSTSCNSTQYNLSSKSLYTTISPVFERDKNDIVSLSSKPNNIISEESNNSNYNYMGEQSWLMSSERANKTSTTKYPQGYNYSTQAICQNPIVDDRYVNNHVTLNIYSPSTATNQTSNNFQALAYNYQNEHNTPPTVDRNAR